MTKRFYVSEQVHPTNEVAEEENDDGIKVTKPTTSAPVMTHSKTKGEFLTVVISTNEARVSTDEIEYAFTMLNLPMDPSTSNKALNGPN